MKALQEKSFEHLLSMWMFDCKVSYRESALDLAAIHYLDIYTSPFFYHRNTFEDVY